RHSHDRDQTVRLLVDRGAIHRMPRRYERWRGDRHERIVVHSAFYFAGNNYSSRVPRYEGEVLVDFERNNVFPEVVVARRLTEWNFEAAAAALGVSKDADLAGAVRAKLLGQG